MTIAWYCRGCGWKGSTANAAFMHRDGGSEHLVRPLTDSEALAMGLEPPFREDGISKHWLEQELHEFGVKL
jgi:hypothetical protein